MSTALGLFASGLLGVGVFILYLAWRERGNRVYALIGWCSILFGTGVWMKVAGGDKGVAISLISLSGMGLVYPALQAFNPKLTKPNKPPKVSRAASSLKMDRRPVAKAGSFISVVLGGFIVAYITALTGYNVARAASISSANAIVFALFLVPIVWALISSVWLMASSTSIRFTWMVGLPCLCIPILYLTRLI